MECELREMSMSMGRAEWEIDRDNPVKEPGSTNLWLKSEPLK